VLPIDYLKIDGEFETLDLLSSLGVDLAQGFHVGRPRPLEEL
jgi:EAL domain-containing protein (putative c-di-GMP-specific phosphodiesterase class I)